MGNRRNTRYSHSILIIISILTSNPAEETKKFYRSLEQAKMITKGKEIEIILPKPQKLRYGIITAQLVKSGKDTKWKWRTEWVENIKDTTIRVPLKLVVAQNFFLAPVIEIENRLFVVVPRIERATVASNRARVKHEDDFVELYEDNGLLVLKATNTKTRGGYVEFSYTGFKICRIETRGMKMIRVPRILEETMIEVMGASLENPPVDKIPFEHTDTPLLAYNAEVDVVVGIDIPLAPDRTVETKATIKVEE